MRLIGEGNGNPPPTPGKLHGTEEPNRLPSLRLQKVQVSEIVEIVLEIVQS